MRLFGFEKITLILLILLFFALALDSLIIDSPIIDEQNHLTRGYSFLTTGDPRLSIEHPPLVNLLSAIPLNLVDELQFSADHTGWQNREWYSVATRFFWQDGNPVTLMVFLGRLPIVFLTIFLALTGFRFGNRLWRQPAGLLTFSALLFDPTIFAHGRYITTDLGGTLFIFLATFAVYNLFHTDQSRPIQAIFLAALTIGLAFASKLTSLVFIPIWIVLALLPLYSQNRSTIGRRLAHLVTAGIASLFVLWAAFGFEWGNFLFIDESMLWLNRFSAPMPTFWSGIERITLISGGGRPSFLWGQYSTEGFLLYFPVAFLAKTPVFVLFALFASLIFLLAQLTTRRKTLWLLIPPLLYFGFSMTSALNIGYRHLMPMLPFVYLIIAAGFKQLVFDTHHSIMIKWLVNRNNTKHALILIIIAAFLLPTVLIHPHQISFFNQLFGGPTNGSNVLVDSNIDWGQDLQRLKHWMTQNGVETINLAWFGTADPALYNLAYTPLPGEPNFRHLWWDVPFDRTNPPPGIYAISVTNLHEMPLIPEEKTVYAYFRNLEPIDQIGYSIMIYAID
ncbi:MAG: 4-amino-4-deoxy-L-arabinose transferase-like glycosyltransferase [Cellvibrionaceae bacterium]|jgi:4-amino-4-deoxy-L-arabinose transferase-like glycosyltransferase